MQNRALEYAGAGLAVFPLSPGTKIPLKGTDGVKGATKDAEKIRGWWRTNPNANIGLAMGAISGIVGIDLDYNHGATDADLAKFPRTVTVKSRRGFHLYYRYPDGGAKNKVVLPGSDGEAAAYLRSDGYYFVAPPSIVSIEKTGPLTPWEYVYHADAGGDLAFGEVELAMLPDWCLDKPVATPVMPASASAYGPNTRHDLFKRTATAMRMKGKSPEAILEALILDNASKCNPPKSLKDGLYDELNSIVDWVVKNVEVAPAIVTAPAAPPPKKKDNGPAEIEIVGYVIDKMGGRVIKQDRDLFRYENGYWRHLQVTDIDQIKQEIWAHYGAWGTTRKVASTFEAILVHLESTPLNMFAPNPFMANFTNGTLHLLRDDDGNYKLDFRAHNPSDFATSILPVAYEPNGKQKNDRFEKFITALFKGDEDELEKLLALKHLFGAALMPAFPKLFFLHGIPGTGKSTVCSLITRLIDPKNISGVDLCEMHGFHLEAMAGKLVNLVTDVNSGRVPDGTVKRIEDRAPVHVNRKGLKAIQARLPSLHIFGANELPKTFEGYTQAHQRRWVFIKFSNVRTNSDYKLFYGDLVYDEGPEAILDFAIEGLHDLCARRGHYCNPASGKERLTEWQMETDVVGLFLQDIEADEVETVMGSSLYKLGIREHEAVNRVILFDIFQLWLRRTGRHTSKMHRSQFLKVLRQKNFGEKIVRGTRYIVGIQISITPIVTITPE